MASPFEFALTETGFATLAATIARAEAERTTEIVRVGVESAGHYHRTLVARLRAGGFDVVELNPAAVKEARAQQLLRRLKGDARDVGAMAELMIRDGGRAPAIRTDALATQAAWVGHWRRRVAARVALANQVIGHLDLVFPGLDGCFSDVLGARSGRVIVTGICDPDRVRRQGVEGLRRFVSRRGVALSGPKATRIVEAAKVALRLPDAERMTRGRLLAADLALLDNLEAEILAAEAALSEVLTDTPAGVLTACLAWRSCGRRTTGPVSATRTGFPTPPLRIARLGWCHDVPVVETASIRPAHQPGGVGRVALGHHRARSGPIAA